MKVKVELKVTIIKRTKITVIRTETIFLKAQNFADAENDLPLQLTDSLENTKQDSALEIEAVKQIKNKDTKKEK